MANLRNIFIFNDLRRRGPQRKPLTISDLRIEKSLDKPTGGKPLSRGARLTGRGMEPLVPPASRLSKEKSGFYAITTSGMKTNQSQQD
jgi:hypothetical protein